MESIALGLILTLACLPAMLPHPAFKAEAPTPARVDAQTVKEPHGFPHPGSKERKSSGTRIRRMPATIITADTLAAEIDSGPAPLAVEMVPTVDILPLTPLDSTASSHP